MKRLPEIGDLVFFANRKRGFGIVLSAPGLESYGERRVKVYWIFNELTDGSMILYPDIYGSYIFVPPGEANC